MTIEKNPRRAKSAPWSLSWNRSRDWLGPLIIAGAALLFFAPVAGHEFSGWDDNYNISQNPRLNPPTLGGVLFYFAHFAYGLYIPVTYTMWALLAKLSYVDQADPAGGHLNPWVFHAANLMFHALAGVMVYRVLRQCGFSRVASTLGGVLFVVHPVQVEAVAWCAGMKDVLSGLLSFGALSVYLKSHSVETDWKRRGFFAAATLLFIAAMLAKPAALATPLVASAVQFAFFRRPVRQWAVGISFWLGLSSFCAVVGHFAQPAVGVPAPALWLRPLVAGDALAFYLCKIVWPAQLTIDYGRRPAEIVQNSAAWLMAGVPLALTLFTALVYRRNKSYLAAWLIFIAALLPVLGFITFLFQFFSTTTDHYLYVAMFASAFALAALTDQVNQRWVTCFLSIILLAAGIRSTLQTQYWKTDVALFSHAMQLNPQSFMAANNLGQLYKNTGDFDRAEKFFRTALASKPDYWEAHENLAAILKSNGHTAEALQHRLKALEIIRNRPPEIQGDAVSEIVSVADDLIEAGRLDEARRFLGAAARHRTDDSQREQVAQRLAAAERRAATHTAATTRSS